MSSYCKSQAYMHPGRVVFHRCINELFDFGKSHNLIEFPINLGFFHTEDRAIQVDVFSPSQFRMKTRAHFQQRTNSPVDLGKAFSWISNAGENLEEGSLASSVAANNAHYFTALNLKGNVSESPDVVGGTIS